MSERIEKIRTWFAPHAELVLARPVLIAVSGLLALSAFCLLGLPDAQQFAREHGPMENLQAGLLLAGFVRLCVHVRQAKESGTRILCALMAWGYLAFLVREFDVRAFNVGWLTLLLSGRVRAAWVAFALLLLAIWALRNLRSVITAAHAWRRTLAAVLMVASGALWLTAAVMESKAMFLEELVETNAAWLMMLAALYALPDSREKSWRS